MSKGHNSYPGYKRTLAGVSLLAASGLLVAACESSSISSSNSASTGSPAATVEASPGVIVVNPRVVLNGANMCSWIFGANPIPLSSRSPVTVRIDDRCNYPQDANPVTDHATGLYSTPEQDPQSVVTTIKDETQVTVECYEPDGEPISDAVGNESSVWLGVDVRQHGKEYNAYLPDVDVGGGYSIPQLASLGLHQCVDFAASPISAHA